MPLSHIEEPSARALNPPAPGVPAERVVTTKELLGDAHRIWIEHAAQRYQLRVTRSGKLILTK